MPVSDDAGAGDVLDGHVAAYEGKSLYDFDNRILLNWYSRRILALAGDASSLLELGIGHGLTAQVFSNHFTKYTILEGSPAVIANFNRNFPSCRVEIIQTLFEAFTTKMKYDLVVMGFVLEHVDDPVAVLGHFRGLLAPGGRLFIAVPNAESMNRRLGFMAGLLSDMSQLSRNDIELGHRRYFTVDSLRAIVEQAGGRVGLLEGIYLKPLSTSQILSLNLGESVIDALCQLGIHYPELSCGLLAEATF